MDREECAGILHSTMRTLQIIKNHLTGFGSAPEDDKDLRIESMAFYIRNCRRDGSFSDAIKMAMNLKDDVLIHGFITRIVKRANQLYRELPDKIMGALIDSDAAVIVEYIACIVGNGKRYMEHLNKMPMVALKKDSDDGATLPKELNTEKAITLLQKAVNMGLCDDSYNWLKSKALLAYFADKASDYLELSEEYYDTKEKKRKIKTSWKPFETLFLKKDKDTLKHSKKNYNANKGQCLPKGYKDVDNLFR